MSVSPRLARAALALSLVTVAALTLTPGEFERGSAFGCVICGERWASDVLANLLLFAPVGAALALAGSSIGRASLAGAAVSLLIEGAQLFVPGRDSSLGDLLFNALGAAVGAMVVARLPRSIIGSPRTATRLALASAAALAPLALAFAALRAPAFPPTEYFGQWVPRLGHLEWYRGRLDSVTVSGLPVPTHRVDDSRELRAALDRLFAGQGTVRIVGTAGPATPALSSLFSIADDAKHEILIVGILRDDVVLRWYSRATSLRLDQPDLRAVGAMRGVRPGDPIAVQVARDGRDWCIAVNDRRSCGLAVGPARAWAHVLWAEGASPVTWIALDALWLGLLGLPVGLWSRRPTVLLAAAAIAAAGLLALPPMLALPPLPVHGILGWCVGVAAGLAAAITFRRMSQDLA